jgi:hypothetical protein
MKNPRVPAVVRKRPQRASGRSPGRFLSAADSLSSDLASHRGPHKFRRVNDEPFEYAIRQGRFGDEFVKLLDGSCLRRPVKARDGWPKNDDK